MSEFKEFICKSKISEPRTITYGKWSIVSTGFDNERHVYVMKDGKIKARMCVDTNVAYGICEIRSINKVMPEIYHWLVDTCCFSIENVCWYDSWEDVDALMWKIIDYIRHAR